MTRLFRILIGVLGGIAASIAFGVPVVGGLLGFALVVFAVYAMMGLADMDRKLGDD